MSDAKVFAIALVWSVSALVLILIGRWLDQWSEGNRLLQTASGFFTCLGALMALFAAGFVL